VSFLTTLGARPRPQSVAANVDSGGQSVATPARPSADSSVRVLDPGQLGASAMAGESHGATQTPGVDPGAPLIGSGFGRSRDLRTFRMGGSAAVTASAVPFDDGVPGNADEAAAHQPRGDADPRRTSGRAGYPGQEAGGELSPYEHVNAVFGSVAGHVELPAHNAGRAAPSEGRPAHVRRALFTRPFDKLAADSLTGHRDVMGAPLAATPASFLPDVDPGVARPSPGGRFAGRGLASGAGNPERNSYRAQPRPWDEDALNVPGQLDPAAVAASTARARGWRAS